MRPMPTLTTLAELPTVTAEQYGMLFQWLPVVLQDGHGVLSESMTLVRSVEQVFCICFVFRAL